MKRWAMIGEEDVPEPCVAFRELMANAPEHIAAGRAAIGGRGGAAVLHLGHDGLPEGRGAHARRRDGVRAQPRPRLRDEAPTSSRSSRCSSCRSRTPAATPRCSLQLALGTPAFFMSRFDPASILETIARPADHALRRDAGDVPDAARRRRARGRPLVDPDVGRRRGPVPRRADRHVPPPRGAPGTARARAQADVHARLRHGRGELVRREDPAVRVRRRLRRLGDAAGEVPARR